MNVVLDKTLILWIIILGIFTAIFIYYFILNPYALKPLCLTDSENCYKINIKKIGNSALVNIDPGNNWYVYEDEKIYVYLPDTNEYHCKDDGYLPVYVIDTKGNNTVFNTRTKNLLRSSGDISNTFTCIKNLDDIIKIFDDKGGEKETIYYRPNKNKKLLDVYDIFNILYSKGVLE